MSTGSVSELWTGRYAPKKVSEVAGNDAAKEAIKKWALEIARGKPKKPLLIYGPPGTGKTALVHALANEMGWIIIESGASDIRTADSVARIAGYSSGGLFGTRLLVFDEIDSAFDRGEIPALTRILSDASGPVIVVANDAKAQKIAPLRKLCDQIEFKKISNGSVRDVLADIAKAEGASGAPVEKIADNAKGDVRGAINDLQAACQGGCGGFPLMSRDRAGDLSTALKTVFKATGFSEAVGAGDGLDMELDTLMLWILENIPAEYEDAEEVAEAMRWVSRSDVFAGRVYRRQDYGMLKYSRALGLAGVAMSKKKPYLKFVQYESHYPTAIRLFGFTKKSRGMRKAIASKIARATHTSTNEAIKAIPFIALLPGAADYFELTEEEKDALQELASGKA